MDKSGHKTNKKTAALNNTWTIDWIDVFVAFHPKAVDYSFFSSAHGTFFRTDHTLGHRTSLNKFKKIEIIWSIFWQEWCETNNQLQAKILQSTQNMGLISTAVNHEWVSNEIKEESKRYLKTNENENGRTHNWWDKEKSSPTSEIHGNVARPQETRNASNKQSKLTPRETVKCQAKLKVWRRKKIIKIRAEINEIESTKTIQNFNETNSWFFKRINKIDKPLTRLSRKDIVRTQINKIRNERGEITTVPKKYKGL